MTVDDVVDLVAPEVPGAVRATIRNAVLMTARDLCTEADIWIETVPAYVPKKQREAEIDPPDENSELLRINSVDGLRPGQYSQPTPSKLRLNSSSEDSRRFSVKAACRPALGAKTLPACMDRWAEALMYGALYRILKMPGQKWTNLQLAADYRQQYQTEEFEAKRLSSNGHHNGARSVQMRPFV